MGRALHRYRRHLIPVWMFALLLVTPPIASWVRLAPLWLLLGGLAAAAAITVVKPGRRRWTTAAAGGFVAVWAAVTEAAGLDWLLTLVLAGGWAGVTGFWWTRLRVRRRIIVVENPVRLLPVGEWWLDHLQRRSYQQALAELAAEWPGMAAEWWQERVYRWRMRRRLTAIWVGWKRIASASEVPGCRPYKMVADRVQVTIYVQHRSGQTHGAFKSHIDHLGSTFRAVAGTLRAEEGEGRRMDRTQIHWVHQDVMAGPGIPYPYLEQPEVTSATQAFSIGVNLYGVPTKIRLADEEDTLVVGMKGSGKSNVLNVVIAAAAGMADVVLWGIDPAGKVEFGPWDDVVAGEGQPIWDRLAGTEAEIGALLDALDRVIQARLVRLRRANLDGRSFRRNWDPRLGPYILLLVDELSYVTPAHRARLAAIVQLCRKVGVRVWVATQHALASETNSTLRSQLARVICLRLKPEAVRVAFGRDAEKDGWFPTSLTRQGTVLIEDAAHQTPITIRTYHLSDEGLVVAAAARSLLRPRLGEEDEAAAAAPPGQATVHQLPGRAAPEPEAPGAPDDRILAVARVLQEATTRGEGLSGREVVSRSGVKRWFVFEKALPWLVEHGLAREIDERWTWVEQANQVPLEG